MSELPRSGAPRKVTYEQVEAIIQQTLESTPGNATHWSTREVAKHWGFSRQTVSRNRLSLATAPNRSAFTPLYINGASLLHP